MPCLLLIPAHRPSPASFLRTSGTLQHSGAAQAEYAQQAVQHTQHCGAHLKPPWRGLSERGGGWSFPS